MSIGALIEQHGSPFYSMEFFPPKDRADWPAFLETVDRLRALNPLFASVTYGAGGSTQDNTLEITRRIAASGLPTMTHLTCVGANGASLREFLDKMREGGVHDVLALRGDLPRGKTQADWLNAEFRHAADLVRFVRREAPDMGVAVAGYPGPHPESPSLSSDRQFTLQKVQAGAEFVVTQLFFDVREYFDLVKYLRMHDVQVPVVPGILPVQSLESIRRVLSLCGANIPGKLYLELEAAHEKGGAEAVREVGLQFAVRQIRRLLDGGAPGIHLYTLNRAELCLRLAQEVKLS
ncbi:MAG: methylenetetrahydrofolate reductase [Desulfovibrionaceae bacterium]|nr:methylenetetrahydrofolate reductase [Desulfovibrionaceae bacterium]